MENQRILAIHIEAHSKHIFSDSALLPSIFLWRSLQSSHSYEGKPRCQPCDVHSAIEVEAYFFSQ